MASAGKLLQAERIKRNLSRSVVAARIRISLRYVEAIEEDNVEILPGEFYYRSFLKQYAQALELDQTTIDDVMASATPMKDPDPLPALSMAYKTAQAEKRASGIRRPRTGLSIALLGMVLVGCSGLYAVWHRIEIEKETPAQPRESAQTTRTPAPNEPEQAPPSTRPASNQGSNQ
jgi:cytoskeletal protein RodZ